MEKLNCVAGGGAVVTANVCTTMQSASFSKQNGTYTTLYT
jgi:hypothetical protein